MMAGTWATVPSLSGVAAADSRLRWSEFTFFRASSQLGSSSGEAGALPGRPPRGKWRGGGVLAMGEAGKGGGSMAAAAPGESSTYCYRGGYYLRNSRDRFERGDQNRHTS
jgi:hypothetical protein